MLEVLRQVLTTVIVISVIVVLWGLMARSNVRAARVFGWFAICWAIAVIIIEGYAWYEKGDWIVTTAAQMWYQIDRDSLNGIQSLLERWISRSAWGAMQSMLQWPGWVMLSLLGLVLLVTDHVQLQLHRKPGAPASTPLRKRVAKWLRGPEKSNDEAQA